MRTTQYPPRKPRASRPLPPPSTDDLEIALTQVVDAIDEARRRRRVPDVPQPLQYIFLEDLAATSHEVLRARELVEAPFDTALRSAARELSKLLARQLTWNGLNLAVERIAAAVPERHGQRTVMLDHLLDGCITRDGNRWIA